MTHQVPPSKFLLITATFVSGLLWYFAFHLSGNFGFLLWIAPIPILWVSLQTRRRTAFLCAFVSYVIGKLSWITLLMQLMPLASIIIVTVLPSLLFALYIILNRWIVLRSQSVISVFAFPAIVSTFEFLVFNNPIDGTAGSMAYTQSNYLLLTQVASVTGIWGVVFVVSLFPSAVVNALYFKSIKRKQFLTLGLSGFVLLLVFAYGAVRLSEDKPHNDVAVGMTVVSEDLYTNTSHPYQARKKIISQYVEQISAVSKRGAAYVLFPEKVIHLKETKKDSLLAIFKEAAAQSNSTIIGGIAIVKDSSRQNLVEFIAPSGEMQEYKKRFHVRNFEANFERGTKIGTLHNTPFVGGMAICKDMDFPQWLREFRDIDLLFVPAFDFVKDGWLHSRMAIFRGIENGYTIVRAARQGRFTVTDYRGKVVAEANSEGGKEVSLLAQAPVYHIDTIYSQWGDWFAWVCVAMFMSFVTITILFKKRSS